MNCAWLNIYVFAASRKSTIKKPVVRGERIDTANIPLAWLGTFTESEFKEVLKFDNKTGRYTFGEDYGDTLQAKLSEKNKVCVIRCNRRVLVQPGDKRYPERQFMSAYAFCKGESCTAHYAFAIRDVPKTTDAVDISIK